MIPKQRHGRLTLKDDTEDVHTHERRVVDRSALASLSSHRPKGSIPPSLYHHICQKGPGTSGRMSWRPREWHLQYEESAHRANATIVDVIVREGDSGERLRGSIGLYTALLYLPEGVLRQKEDVPVTQSHPQEFGGRNSLGCIVQLFQTLLCWSAHIRTPNATFLQFYQWPDFKWSDFKGTWAGAFPGEAHRLR